MPDRPCFTSICTCWADDVSAGLQADQHDTLRGPLTRTGMPLFDTLQADLNAARKAQDKARVLVLGTIFSDAKNRKIELRRDLTDDEVVDVLRKGIKRRRESIEMYAGKRDDLAEKERAEVAILETYLPAAVMGKVLPQFKGRAEGS